MFGLGYGDSQPIIPEQQLKLAVVGEKELVGRRKVEHIVGSHAYKPLITLLLGTGFQSELEAAAYVPHLRDKCH